VIPLVQTFGHMEFILKHESFAALRDTPEMPESICACHDHTMPLLMDYINQVPCCETAGFSCGYKMNRLNKSLLINVFQVWSMAFIPVKKKPDIRRESDAKAFSRVKLSRRKVSKGDMVTLRNYVNVSNGEVNIHLFHIRLPKSLRTDSEA
jgi:hypothetical protein